MKPLLKKKKSIAWYVGPEGGYLSKAHQRREIRHINKVMDFFEAKRFSTKRHKKLCSRGGHLWDWNTASCSRCGFSQYIITYAKRP